LGEKSLWTLREIQERLEKIYSEYIGIEFMHISDAREREWIMKEFEQLATETTPKEEKITILKELTKSETFNVFLNDKLKTSKRFGVEGLDSMISGLSTSSSSQTDLWK
jgi:2-oxoglutarate dehydrogenase E1 component